jgi:hypothetical protein
VGVPGDATVAATCSSPTSPDPARTVGGALIPRAVVAAVGGIPAAADRASRRCSGSGPRSMLYGALVAESLTYGLLQSGPMYQEWLAAVRTRQHVASTRPVIVERDGPRPAITLNRPEVRNAFDVAMRTRWSKRSASSPPTRSITSVEWRGAGDNFCSGGDLAEFGTVPDPVTGHLVRMSRSAAWRSPPWPTA